MQREYSGIPDAKTIKILGRMSTDTPELIPRMHSSLLLERLPS